MEKYKSGQKKGIPPFQDLKEGIHFYFEGGFMVFTEAYHLLRGHCCESGCRHCPYKKRE